MSAAPFVRARSCAPVALTIGVELGQPATATTGPTMQVMMPIIGSQRSSRASSGIVTVLGPRAPP